MKRIKYYKLIVTLDPNDTANRRSMSPYCMKQLAVLLVFSSLFTTVNVKGLNKLIQIQIQFILRGYFKRTEWINAVEA